MTMIDCPQCGIVPGIGHHCPPTHVQELQAEVAYLIEQLRIATETLNEIARCGCAACGPAPRDLAHARTLADDALTRMDTMG